MFFDYLKKYLFIILIFLSSKLFAIEFDGKFIQGHFIVGKTQPKTK